MKRYSQWLARLLPSPSEGRNDPVGIAHGYKHFSRGLKIILIVLVFTPLTLISTLSYFQYTQLLQEEEQDQLILNLKQAQSTIEAFVSELQSIIKFVARDDRYEELLNPHELEALFVRLKEEYPGFADIEIIDSLGQQKAYFGPYVLEAHDYKEQIWYQQVLRQGVYISNIFTGFRNVPHFVIAVNRKHPDKRGHWVIRMTIDVQTLQHFIDTIRTSYVDDMFLIDSEYIVQTEPQKYGKIGKECVLKLIDDLERPHVIESVQKISETDTDHSDMMIVRRTFKGKEINQAVGDLLDTPWKLVIVKDQYLHANSWFKFKIKMTTMFIICVIIAVFVIAEISNALTHHIRESDKKRRQLYSEAEQSNKLASIGRLAAGVAHEINNPLSIINQKTGLVQDYLEMSDDFQHKELMKEAHDSIQNSVERCKIITHRLLGFARVTDVKTEEFDINDALREVVDFLAKEALYNQIHIDFELDDRIGNIVSDRSPLQQIFLNITNNAIDAIGSNGKIILLSRLVNQENIEVEIIDNGPGMPEEVRERIFEPFFTTKVAGKGTGLGLSITYGLVKKLGGDIKVISETGKGTTFTITLPVKQDKCFL